MMKLFRQIRQRLLTKNKFTTYILYGVGEIILVVIGILIALQLNIYNENRNNKKVEINYLKGIVNELDQDIYELSELMFKDTTLFDSYTIILQAFTDKNINVYSSSFLNAIRQANTSHAFDGNSIIFEDMKSSGKINLIKNNALRFSILKYYNNSEESIKNQNEFIQPQITDLNYKAFLTNIDLNSLIEQFIFRKKWSAAIDQLDLSFFEKDINSKEVKMFANSISMMKALTLSNNRANQNLMYEAKKQKAQILEYLIAEKVEIRNEVPKQTLEAIKNGNIAYLERTISTAYLNDCFYMSEESGNYLVHSITYKSLKSLKFFIEKGADIENVCENKTPLMYAIKYGELEMVKFLVKKGANLKASNHGKTPLYYARVYKHPEIEKYLRSIQN